MTQPMNSRLTVASLQMVSEPDLQANLNTARELIAQAAAQGARLIALPEYFCMMGNRDKDKLEIAEHIGHGPMQDFIAEQAVAHNLYIIAGTMPLLSETDGRVYNSCLVFNPKGKCITRYDKIHLFRFRKGDDVYDESDVLTPGTVPAVADVDGFKVGLAVCYDLRFPELFRAMGTVDIVVLPAAFVYATGQAHWEILLRARAIENQCYLLSCGQGGTHANNRKTWGHSMWINPWGEIENVLAEGQGVVIGHYDPAKIADVRSTLPALTHRVL